MVYLAVIGLLCNLKKYQRAIGLYSTQVVVYLAVIGLPCNLKMYLKAVGLRRTQVMGVLGGDRALLPPLNVPHGDRAYLQDSEVLEGTRAQHTSRGVLGGDRAPLQGTDLPAEDRAQQGTSRGALGGGRAYFEYNGVNSSTRAQHTSRGVLGGDRVPFSFDEVEAQGSSGLRGSSQRLRQWDSRYGRPVSRSASPEPRPRIASGSPGRHVRSGSAQGLLRGRYLRRNADELLGGLSDGDLYGVRPTEMPYSAGPAETGPTFGDYDVGYPPGLGVGSRVPPEGAESQPPPATASSPSPLDVLITGMSQLQQVLLKQKTGDAMDLEVKGVQELPKLPEYTPETGATDFQDYLYLTEQQVGSLASGATEWWQKTAWCRSEGLQRIPVFVSYEALECTSDIAG